MSQVHRFQFGNEATRFVTKNDTRCPVPSSLRMRRTGIPMRRKQAGQKICEVDLPTRPKLQGSHVVNPPHYGLGRGRYFAAALAGNFTPTLPRIRT